MQIDKLVLYILLLAPLMTTRVFASSLPLFSSSTKTEKFKIEDDRGHTPEFSILNHSASERVLATAVNGALGLGTGSKVQLKVEALSFTPTKEASDNLRVIARISGHDFELDKTVSKRKLVSGELIDLNFPNDEQSIALVDFTSNGHLKFRYRASTQDILIADAKAHIVYNSPLGEDGTETLQFSGRGTRIR